MELTVFCGSSEMVEPNDIVVASNGRVFATGMYWGRDTQTGAYLYMCTADVFYVYTHCAVYREVYSETC
jgi:hypothetical protein